MKIKVDFLFQWAPGWSNYASVLAALEQDDNFICRLVLLPFHHSGILDHENAEARAFLDAQEISWVWHEDYDYIADKPDMVFIQNPYDFTRPERFSCRALKAQHIKYAYIPYGLDVGEGETNLTFQYNMECHNFAQWIFVRSAQHKRFYKQYCQAGNKHVHVTGHPKFDRVSQWVNPVKEERKVLLWTPHFQEGDAKGWSTFNLYCDTMLYIALTYPVMLIVRPHPLFIGRLKAFGGTAVEKFSRLIEYAKASNNITLDFDSSYDESFTRADALLTDAGSFLLEYLPTQKPILYLTHEGCFGLNKSASFVHQSYYVAHSEQDIDNFVQMLLAGEDPKKSKRLAALRDNFYIPPVSAAQEIRQILVNHFAAKIAKKTRLFGNQDVTINESAVLDFFESRATQKENSHPLTMTMYQSVELATQRDVHEKALITPKLHLFSDANVLDIGCGNGRWYEALQPEGVLYTGIDFSPALIAIAEEKYSRDPRSAFHVKNAYDLTPELMASSGRPFTHVIISGVLLYLNNEEVFTLFKKLAAIIEPGTVIFIREPLAMEQRLTLKSHWSEELKAQYNAIYRTADELQSFVDGCSDVLSLQLLEMGPMYPQDFNNRKETQQHYLIYKSK
ncbi:methyltransferase domain-containing protein [Kluyvera genomosp. 1]|uniref:methyltransferase domain-containing protein n=1 Tax=Kluyvera genomosp. 1 TaxID=2774053 RepID=UPI00068A855E|nr:methyltransferase domain-containing protein [Kluyvera genomosp. 1]